MFLTEALARLTLETPTQDFSCDLHNTTKRVIVDTIAATIAGWREPGIPAALKCTRAWGGTPEATVLVYGDKMPAPNAAFVNGCMCHALDYDDVYYETSLHIMSSVFATALAAAEIVGATGRDLLAALIVGVEVAGRIGLVIQSANTGYGFLPSSLAGGFGATAAASRLFGLTQEQTMNALGINYAQASGNRQALLDTTLTKRMQPAYAGRSALWAVALAREGVTGAREALEGAAGFFPLYIRCDAPSVEELLRPLGYWQIERVAVKPFPACGGVHRTLQASITLAQEENLDPANIARVEAWVPYINVHLLGKPFVIARDPQVDAQFSVAYSAALGLVRRRAGLSEYRPATIIGDELVLDVARRTQVLELPNSKGKRTHEMAHQVKVWTRDGRVLSRQAQQLHGLWQDPYTDDELDEKFRDCAAYSGICPPATAETILRALRQFESVQDIRRFVAETLVLPGAKLNL